MVKTTAGLTDDSILCTKCETDGGHADLSERINRHGSLRAIAWNAGVMLAALAAALGSQVGEARTIAARVGWGLMLATALGLGATILLPRPRRNATGSP